MNDCVFCTIARHEKPVNIVWEDEHVIAFVDMDPITDGHTLIVPKKDIRDIHELDDESNLHIMRAAKVLAGVIEKTFGFDGTEIRAVSGAFQDVPHFHLHVFGRNINNDLSIAYPSGINNEPKYVSMNAEKIRKNMI